MAVEALPMTQRVGIEALKTKTEVELALSFQREHPLES